MLRRYRPLFLALSVLILLLLAYTAWWAALAGKVRSTLAALPEKVKAEKGLLLDLRDPVVSGFPLSVRVELAGADAVWPSGTRVQVGAIMAEAPAWNPTDIYLSAQAPIRLDLAGSARHAPISGTATGMVARVDLAVNGKPRLASATLTGVRTETEAPLVAAEAVVTWVAPAKVPEGPTDPQGQVGLFIRDLDLPNDPPPPLTRRVEQLSLFYEARGPLPTKPSIAGMTSWRDGGGTLEIQTARMVWNGMDLRMNATLALDGNMQPEGAGAVSLSGADIIVDGISRQRGLSAGEIQAAKNALARMSKRTDDGRNVLELPITLQNSRLSLGPFPLTIIPPIDWN